MILVQHPDLKTPDGQPVVKSVAEEALGILGASGWVALDSAEVKAYQQRLVDEKAARFAKLGGPPVEKKKPARKQDATPENESDH